MRNTKYYPQVELLLRILPVIARTEIFALKGGTAINLFYRDMPRLSVDIDLTYLPIDNRDTALKNITSSLGQIERDILRLIPGTKVRAHRIREQKTITKLTVESGAAFVKIEPNTILRGVVNPPGRRTTSAKVIEEFNVAVTTQVVSLEDLYAGKICAALDRQHPRDLFDIKELLDNEGITKEIRRAFVVYLVSHNRPMDELLRPNRLEMLQVFEDEFQAMTRDPVTYLELEDTRERLIKLINDGLTDSERSFLLSIAAGEPNWTDFDQIAQLPAVRWKLTNIAKMSKQKRESACATMRQVLKL